jgi:hypothetical protein
MSLYAKRRILRIKPGDRLAIVFPEGLSMEQADQIAEQLHQRWGDDIRIALFSGDVELTVIRSDGKPLESGGEPVAVTPGTDDGVGIPPVDQLASPPFSKAIAAALVDPDGKPIT